MVGNETAGASTQLVSTADPVVRIPMHGQMESLNVGVATGLSLYELWLKRILSMLEENIRSTIGRELNVASQLVLRVLDREPAKVSNFSSGQVVFLMVLKCDRTMAPREMRNARCVSCWDG